MSQTNRDQLWDEFLETWPPSRVASMTLEEYVKIGSKDTLTSWLESKLETLGSIWGGSSYKFGIYQFNPEKEEKANTVDNKYKSDDKYSWYLKYGNTREEAFNTTKQSILAVIEAARSGKLESIGPMKLGRAFKWKIASLYQDRTELPITPIFDKAALRYLTGDQGSGGTVAAFMRQLRELRGDSNFWEFTDASWKKWKDHKPLSGKINGLIEDNTRYWLYAPGQGGAYWEEFHNKGIMAIGWDKLGDLSLFDSKESIAQALRDNSDDHDSSKKNNATACWSFLREIKIGDVIFAKIGRSRIVGRGVVTSNYRFEPARQIFRHVRDVTWEIKGEWTVTDENRFALKTLTEVTDYTNFLKHLLGLTGGEIVQLEEKDLEETPEVKPKNLILYGPPGTGKTYALQNEYFSIYQAAAPKTDEVGPINFEDYNWLAIITATLSLLGEKSKVAQILEHPLFTAKATSLGRTKNLRETIWSVMQWHTPPESKTVNFEKRQEPFVFDKNTDSEWELSGNWKEDCPEAVELAEHWKKLALKKGAVVNAITLEDRYTFVTFHQSYSYEDFIEGIRPSADAETRNIQYEVKPGIFRRICNRAKADPLQRYAIFIDEINRGNIAKIFGELITLIEDNKRCEYDTNGRLINSGLEVTLPYSGERFGVPTNLDIYGTMNTADRSIALLDVALRRRFQFREVAPESEFIPGADSLGKIPDEEGGVLDLRALLDAINQRLHFLRDRDHLIGHSFFMDCRDLESVREVLLNQVLPLLQEYFYNDFGRIQKVLRDLDERGKPYSDSIIRSENLSSKELFGIGDESEEDRCAYSVSASEEWTPAVLRRIYGA